MRSIIHQVIIKVDSRLVDEISMGKTKLYLEATYDIYKNTKIKGEVVSVPHKLNGTVLYSETEGYPPYHGKKDNEGKYYPTNHQTTFITMESQEVKIKVGDTAYFHYLTLSEHNYLGKADDGGELYKCAYDQLFGYVREKNFHLVNGWIAVLPIQDDSFEEIEIPEVNIFQHQTGTRKIRVKQSGGIIYDMNEEAVFRHGKIAMVSPPADNKDYQVAVGDTIIYSDWSEFKNKIEGVEYFMMRLHDVVARYRDGKIEPVGYYCLMDATDVVSKLIIPDKYKKKADEATIIDVGSFVDEIQPLDGVRFYDKEAYYVPVEDKKLCFIKSQYIWGIQERI